MVAIKDTHKSGLTPLPAVTHLCVPILHYFTNKCLVNELKKHCTGNKYEYLVYLVIWMHESRLDWDQWFLFLGP